MSVLARDARCFLTRRTRDVEGRKVAMMIVEADELDWQTKAGIRRAWAERFPNEDAIPGRVILDLRRAKKAEDYGSDYTSLALCCFNHLRDKKRDVCFGVCLPSAGLIETFNITRLSDMFPAHTDQKEILEIVASVRRPKLEERLVTAVCPRCHQPISCPHCNKKSPSRKK